MKKIALLTALLFAGVIAFAQNRQVTGVVKDAKTNTGIISATVSVKGQLIYTSTNADGKFSISVPPGRTVLEVSSVGYGTTEMVVEAGTSEVSFAMDTKSEALSEVVVTAFGISKQKKALAYSVTQIDGDQFTQSRTANLGNALAGKIAGVNVTTPATGAAGSSRVVIRGGGTLGGSGPLYVVNGIPIESSNRGSAGTWGGNDGGDGLSAINPDDIESISVLKGNTASALYGSRASGGVILITTKSGKRQKGMGISFNSNITTDRAIDQTDFQDQYGPGRDGLKAANQTDALDIGGSHWGEKLDGSQVVQFDGVSRAYSNTGEGINDFYRTGLTINNSLALSGGSETGNYRMAFSDLDNKDIMPNAAYKRQAINININSKLKNLTLSATGQYSKQKASNRPRLSDSPGNGNFTVLTKPNTLPYSVIKGTSGKFGALADGFELRYQGNVFQTNPYWAAYQFFRKDNIDRFFGNVSLKYNFTKWLYVQGRMGTDFQTIDNASSEPYGTAYKPRGDYNESFVTIRQDNYDVFIGAEKTFGDFNIDLLLGGAQLKSTVESKGGGGNDLVVPFVSSVTNVAAPSFSYGYSAQGTNSIFASANVGYKNYLYLNLTGRKDIYSTLAPENNTLLYPSVGMSFILSDAFKLPEAITFGKLRASWAQVGGGAPTPYQLLLSYGLVGVGHLGGTLGTISNGSIPNQKLQPEISTEFEVGADFRFLNNRLGIDVAYYDRKVTDLILNTSISATSGFGSTTINVGEIANKGIELLLTGTPIKTKDWNWDLTLNFAKNKNKVINLGNDASGNPIKSQGGEESRVRRERISNIVGEPQGMITGYKHKTTSKGEKIYTADGYPVATAGYETIATGVHPVSAGLNSALRYQNFTLEFLIDIRQGGHLVSGTNYFAYSYGLHKETLNGRNGDLKVSGVLDNGTPLNVTIPKDKLDDYYARYAQITENMVYDASFGKLRQLSLGYTIPKKMLAKTPFESLSVSLVGRNLALLWSKVPNIDPESAYSVNSGAQGLEFFALPQTRSFGINISANF
jgi:TonB-linked SusC/RagA family outer membrane protein